MSCALKVTELSNISHNTVCECSCTLQQGQTEPAADIANARPATAKRGNHR